MERLTELKNKDYRYYLEMIDTIHPFDFKRIPCGDLDWIEGSEETLREHINRKIKEAQRKGSN